MKPVLYPCPICSHNVSTLAKSCPQCGQPFEPVPSIVVTDIRISFAAMFTLCCKLAFALIPVYVIIALIFVLLSKQ